MGGEMQTCSIHMRPFTYTEREYFLLSINHTFQSYLYQYHPKSNLHHLLVEEVNSTHIKKKGRQFYSNTRTEVYAMK